MEGPPTVKRPKTTKAWSSDQAFFVELLRLYSNPDMFTSLSVS